MMKAMGGMGGLGGAMGKKGKKKWYLVKNFDLFKLSIIDELII